jgi:PHD/YefM family antitoxin component YafN of YafNO toxin-antitoxin module
MNNLSASEACENLPYLIEQVAATHTPVLIKGKTTEAILIAKEDWEAIQETLYLTSIPGMKESILEGGSVPLDECIPFRAIDR